MEKNNNIHKPSQYSDVITIAELIQTISKWWKFLLSKWLIILIAGIIGGSLGLGYSFLKAPRYTAKLSFALVEGGQGISGLADLASSFGLNGLFSGNRDAFSGDNLLEIIKSKYTIEQTLLTPVFFKGQQKTLADAYIQVSGIRKKWNKNKKVPELKTLSYPIGQPQETFTRVQDSIINVFYEILSHPSSLTVERKSKKVSIVMVNFSSSNEQFSKLFVENLLNQTYIFYKNTRTAQIRENIQMMELKADSIKELYNQALYKSASVPQVNVNLALRTAAVPFLKQETDAQIYGTVYVEVLKNLEALKLDLARETPLVQIIDLPRYPLLKNKFGKLKGIILGGMISVFLTALYLILKERFSLILKEN